MGSLEDLERRIARIEDAEAIKRGTFAPLRTRGCPAPLEMAITSCLQPSPFARTQSIASFALNIATFGSSRSKILIPKLNDASSHITLMIPNASAAPNPRIQVKYHMLASRQ